MSYLCLNSNIVHILINYVMSCCILFFVSFFSCYFRILFIFIYIYLSFFYRVIFICCFFCFSCFYLLGLKAHFLWLKISTQLDQVEAQNGGPGHRPVAQAAGPAVASQLPGALQAQACWLAGLLALLPAFPHEASCSFGLSFPGSRNVT